MYLASREPIDVFLQPGDFYFGEAGTRIRTLLGSCVAITLWHPVLHIGGMCHIMLPDRGGRSHPRLDGRYADEAMALFLHELKTTKTSPQDYVVKLFGGGRMYAMRRSNAKVIDAMDVGQRNIAAARKLLHQNGFCVSAEHLAGDGHRNVIFDLISGDAWIRHVEQLQGGLEAQASIQGGK
jgi:chemotaxis protein CheD